MLNNMFPKYACNPYELKPHKYLEFPCSNLKIKVDRGICETNYCWENLMSAKTGLLGRGRPSLDGGRRRTKADGQFSRRADLGRNFRHGSEGRTESEGGLTPS